MAESFSERMATVVAEVALLFREQSFRKQRHTFNRETEEGLVQVVGFQMGPSPPPGAGAMHGDLHGSFTINLGVYFDEVRRCDRPESPRPKFVHDYDCQVRVRVGQLVSGRDLWWELSQAGVEQVGRALVAEVVLPFLDEFASRRALLDARRAGDPRISGYSTWPPFCVAVVHAHVGELAEAEALLIEDLRDTEREGRASLAHRRGEAARDRPLLTSILLRRTLSGRWRRMV